MKLNTDIFIERCKKIHGDKYDYSKVEYKTNRDSVEIICNKHGIFSQRPDAHMKDASCKLCKDDEKRGNILDFIKRSNEMHRQKTINNEDIYCRVDAYDPINNNL